MNDSVLSDRLRALRVPPPGNGFEQRLGQALWREAQALRAERSPERPGAVARARRWGGRTGLAMALVLGATAAAAAGGGAWVWIASGERAVAPVPAPPLQPTERAQRPAAATVGTEPAPTEHAADLASPAPSPAEVNGSKFSVPAAARLKSDLPEVAPAPGKGQPAARAVNAVNAGESRRVGLAKGAAAGPLLPLELPSREISRAALGGTPASGPAALALPERGGGATASDRRSLPELRSRADRLKDHPDRPGQDRAHEPPGQAIAGERSARDKTERD